VTTPAHPLTDYADDDCIDITCRGRRSGRPHTVEIWFGIDGTSLYLISGNGATADWYRNMIADPAVTVCFADGSERQGRARAVVDAGERRRVGDLMGTKYPWDGDPSIGLTRQAWCYDAPVIAVEFDD
jgi:deazaflavin-dependent oxidoreductase (nitroreductase family)